MTATSPNPAFAAPIAEADELASRVGKLADRVELLDRANPKVRAVAECLDAARRIVRKAHEDLVGIAHAK